MELSSDSGKRYHPCFEEYENGVLLECLDGTGDEHECLFLCGPFTNERGKWETCKSGKLNRYYPEWHARQEKEKLTIGEIIDKLNLSDTEKHDLLCDIANAMRQQILNEFARISHGSTA